MKNKRFVIPRRGNRISAALNALKMWAPSPDWESKGPAVVAPSLSFESRILTTLIRNIRFI